MYVCVYETLPLSHFLCMHGHLHPTMHVYILFTFSSDNVSFCLPPLVVIHHSSDPVYTPHSASVRLIAFISARVLVMPTLQQFWHICAAVTLGDTKVANTIYAGINGGCLHC